MSVTKAHTARTHTPCQPARTRGSEPQQSTADLFVERHALALPRGAHVGEHLLATTLDRSLHLSGAHLCQRSTDAHEQTHTHRLTRNRARTEADDTPRQSERSAAQRPPRSWRAPPSPPRAHDRRRPPAASPAPSRPLRQRALAVGAAALAFALASLKPPRTRSACCLQASSSERQRWPWWSVAVHSMHTGSSSCTQ